MPFGTLPVGVLLYTMWYPGYKKKPQHFSEEDILSFCLDFQRGFGETKISTHQRGTEKSSHNPEYENMSRAACKMDLHTSELHIQLLDWAS